MVVAVPTPPDKLVDWPETLVGQIASGRWVLFVGAGVAATCTNDDGQSPPGWVGLLTALAHAGIPDDIRDSSLALIASRDLLRAAEQIRWAFESTARAADFFTLLRRAVEGPEGHLFEHSDLYATLVDLNPTIVITTNYDRLFESAVGLGFDSLPYKSDHIATKIRRGEPILLKLHGRVEEMPEVVLTRRDYLKLNREGATTLDTVRSLFRTHTVLFVGYGMNDPDVQLMLEAASGYCDPESHYLVTRDAQPEWELTTFRDYYGVSCLRYEAAQPLKAVMDELLELVRAKWTALGIAT